MMKPIQKKIEVGWMHKESVDFWTFVKNSQLFAKEIRIYVCTTKVKETLNTSNNSDKSNLSNLSETLLPNKSQQLLQKKSNAIFPSKQIVRNTIALNQSNFSFEENHEDTSMIDSPSYNMPRPSLFDSPPAVKSAYDKPKVVEKFTCDHENCVKFLVCEMDNEKEVYKILLPSNNLSLYDRQKVRCLPLAA